MVYRYTCVVLTFLFAVAAYVNLAQPAGAQTRAQMVSEIPVPVRPIKAGEVIGVTDLAFVPLPARRAADTIVSLDDVVGLEARRDLPAGRAVLARSIGPVRVVRRNTPVTLVYQAGAVRVEADGLALADASVGDMVRAANAKTRQMVTGLVGDDGRIQVK